MFKKETWTDWSDLPLPAHLITYLNRWLSRYLLFSFPLTTSVMSVVESGSLSSPEPCWWWKRVAKHWRRGPGGLPASDWPSVPSDRACEPGDAHCSLMATNSRGQQLILHYYGYTVNPITIQGLWSYIAIYYFIDCLLCVYQRLLPVSDDLLMLWWKSQRAEDYSTTVGLSGVYTQYKITAWCHWESIIRMWIFSYRTP